MLHLAVFTLLQSAVYIAVRADLPYPTFSSISDKKPIPNQNWYATGPVIPDPNTNFGFGAKDNTLRYLKNPSVPSVSSELSLSKQSSQTCRKRVPIIDLFSNNFVERVMASEKVRAAFQTRGFNAKSLSCLFHDIVFKAISAVNAVDAAASARMVSDAVAINFDKLDQDTVPRIYGDAVGSYLFYRGYLTSSNVASLSEEYFTFTERAINAVKNSTPEENFRAISDSFVGFLSSLGFFDPYSTPMVSGFFVAPWYEL